MRAADICSDWMSTPTITLARQCLMRGLERPSNFLRQTPESHSIPAHSECETACTQASIVLVHRLPLRAFRLGSALTTNQLEGCTGGVKNANANTHPQKRWSRRRLPKQHALLVASWTLRPKAAACAFVRCPRSPLSPRFPLAMPC